MYFILFADDTIFCSSSDLGSLITPINAELSILSTWFYANKLSLNVSKTSCILFSNHKSQNVHHEIILENKPIKKVSTKKFLGVELDSKLSWKDHIRLLEKRFHHIYSS